MGIDVYMVWNKMTEAEQEQQYTFSVASGSVGYLREAYHGGPYATRVLVPEGFEPEKYPGIAAPHPIYGDVCQCARIPARSLFERVPAAEEAMRARHRTVYKQVLADDAPEVKSLHDFADLYARLESEGKEPRVYVSW